jgi:hypothetical protein
MVEECLQLAGQNIMVAVTEEFLAGLDQGRLNVVRMMLAAHRTEEDELLGRILCAEVDAGDDEEEGVHEVAGGLLLQQHLIPSGLVARTTAEEEVLARFRFRAGSNSF